MQAARKFIINFLLFFSGNAQLEQAEQAQAWLRGESI